MKTAGRLRAWYWKILKEIEAHRFDVRVRREERRQRAREHPLDPFTQAISDALTGRPAR